LLAGYVLCGFIAIVGLVVAWKIASGKIDISNILLEKDGTPGSQGAASMARFQLLIFVFVIAISFFLVVISNIKIIQAKGGGDVPKLPEVPSGVMALLGISASSYAVGKAIQHGAGTGGTDTEPTAAAHRPAAPGAGQAPVVR
jgi:hypothetical protein